MSEDSTNSNTEGSPTEWWPDAVRMLDCGQCRGQQSMAPVKIPRFNLVLRLVGFILLVPSFLGFAVAALMIVASVSSPAGVGGPASAMGLMVGFGLAIIICVISLVMGLIGWILVWNRKVWKCSRCGYYVNRD
jgi:hypothetical protein